MSCLMYTQYSRGCTRGRHADGPFCVKSAHFHSASPVQAVLRLFLTRYLSTCNLYPVVTRGVDGETAVTWMACTTTTGCTSLPPSLPPSVLILLLPPTGVCERG